jgi:Transposase IS116/IS110/IS902 family
VGIDTAAILLVAAGDNAERLRNEAAWAHFCGVAPIEASSGKTVRHRLNRGADRQANHALWRIVITRMSSDARTKTYVARRLAEGRTKPEISSAYSDATSPARFSSTYLANSSLPSGAVWPDNRLHAHGAVLLTICRPATRANTPTNSRRGTRWLHKSLPSNPSGPSLSCRTHPRRPHNIRP